MNVSVLREVLQAGAVVAVLLGILSYRWLANWGPVGRMAAVVLPLLAFIGAGDLIMGLFNAPYAVWNAPRLAPTFALWHGYPLYYGAESGPVLGNIYGPVLALAYLPTVIFPLPSLALRFGVLLSIGYYFIPIICLHLKRPERDGRRLVLAGLGTVCFLFMTMLSPPLKEVVYSIHADVPGLSLCGLACFFLYGESGRHSRRTFLPAAVCSVLAVWTKQTMVPILFALPLYLWLAEGRRTCLGYVKYLVVCLGLISALFLAWFGAEPIFFNMFVIPAHHPWYVVIDGSPKWLQTLALPPRFAVLLEAGAQLVQFCLAPLAVLAGHIVYKRYFSATKLITLRNWCVAQPWTLPALVGVCMAPTSMLGRVKVGGDINSLAFSSYFLFAAASLVLVQETAAHLCALELRGCAKRARISTFCIMMALSVLAYTGTRFQIYLVAYRGVMYADQAFYFLKAHPSEAYFPWDPLGHLMAEGKLYHFCYGVFDREIAGYPLSKEQIRNGLPPQLKEVAYGGLADHSYALRYLPEFSQRDLSHGKEMPTSTVFVRQISE